MTWNDIELELKADLETLTKSLKELAPKDSTYTGLYNYRKSDFIFVEGKRVYTNTNSLYNSITYDLKTTSGKNLIATTKVVGDIPYYDKVVNEPFITVALHYGRSEYGSIRYPSSEIYQKENRNYNYYVEQGLIEMLGLSLEWNGRTFNVKDKIGDFK